MEAFWSPPFTVVESDVDDDEDWNGKDGKAIDVVDGGSVLSEGGTLLE